MPKPLLSPSEFIFKISYGNILLLNDLVYLDDEVWGPEPEAALGGQDLQCFFDSARQG